MEDTREDIRKDCFAYKIENNNQMCNCLNNLECKNCPFYKHKSEVKDNIFYKFSFKNYDSYVKAVEKYYLKYGIGNLNLFEE